MSSEDRNDAAQEHGTGEEEGTGYFELTAVHKARSVHVTGNICLVCATRWACAFLEVTLLFV